MAQTISHWGEYGARPRPLAVNADLFAHLEVRESVEVDCTLKAAWSLVTDVTRIGEFSPECIDACWVDGTGEVRVGSRFDGTNRVVDDENEILWIRPCTVTAIEPGRRFAYAVGDRYDGSPASMWEFELEPRTGGVCRINQIFRHHRDGLSGLRHAADADPERAGEIVTARSAGVAEGMRQTLQRMKTVLEQRPNPLQ